MPCDHDNLGVRCQATRDKVETGDPLAYTLDLEVACKDCGAPFGFRGMPADERLGYWGPVRSRDATCARLPLLSPTELVLQGDNAGVKADPPPCAPAAHEVVIAPRQACPRTMQDVLEQEGERCSMCDRDAREHVRG